MTEPSDPQTPAPDQPTAAIPSASTSPGETPTSAIPPAPNAPADSTTAPSGPSPSAASQSAPPPNYPPAQPYQSAPPPSAGYGYGQGGGVAVPPGYHYDVQSGLTLPDGTDLASVGRRIGAYFLGILLFIVTLGIGWIIWGLLIWPRGQTPALQVLGMRCYRPEEGRVPGFWWMAMREVIGRIAEGILGAITQLTSFILFCVTKQRKAIHDYVAGTVVLYDPNKFLAPH